MDLCLYLHIMGDSGFQPQYAVPESVVKALERGQWKGKWVGWFVIVDVEGFTEFTAEMEVKFQEEGTERVVEALEATFEPLFRLVRRSGGEIIYFTGDGLIARWETREHAYSVACRALEIHTPLRFSVALSRGTVHWCVLQGRYHDVWVTWGDALHPARWWPLTSEKEIFVPYQKAKGLIDRGEEFFLLQNTTPSQGRFVPPYLRGEKGMFRHLPVVFALYNIQPHEDPTLLAKTTLEIAELWGGGNS